MAIGGVLEKRAVDNRRAGPEIIEDRPAIIDGIVGDEETVFDGRAGLLIAHGPAPAFGAVGGKGALADDRVAVEDIEDRPAVIAAGDVAGKHALDNPGAGAPVFDGAAVPAAGVFDELAVVDRHVALVIKDRPAAVVPILECGRVFGKDAIRQLTGGLVMEHRPAVCGGVLREAACCCRDRTGADKDRTAPLCCRVGQKNAAGQQQAALKGAYGAAAVGGIAFKHASVHDRQAHLSIHGAAVFFGTVVSEDAIGDRGAGAIAIDRAAGLGGIAVDDRQPIENRI